jgi:serine/threonine protein kinase
LKKKKIIPEKDAIDYLKQLLNGMKGLHELNVIHRDLKLPNILINNGIIKIADLGFAKRLNNKVYWLYILSKGRNG